MATLPKSHPKRKKDIDEEFKAKIRNLHCIICCALPPSTVSHLKTRGSGGDDAAYNILPMCLKCHTYWESNKEEFITKYPHFADHLKAMGWKWSKVQGKFYLRHYG